MRAAVIVLGGYLVVSAALIGLGVLVTHAAFLASLRHWDDSVNRWFASDRTSGLDRLSGALSSLADTIGILAVAAIVLVILTLRKHARRALLVLIGLPLELLVFLTVNYSVDRPRPNVLRVGSSPSTYSFPSGHIAATIVLYGSIALLVGWRLRRHLLARLAVVIAVVLACGVSWARVYRGMHHPTDVIAGAVMGLSCLAVARWALLASAGEGHQAYSEAVGVGARP